MAHDPTVRYYDGKAQSHGGPELDEENEIAGTEDDADMTDKVVLAVGDEVFVALAHHMTGWYGDERMLMDEDGEETPDLDEVIVGVFAREDLARTACEAYTKEHNAILRKDEEREGHGKVRSATVSSTRFGQHGTGNVLAWFSEEDGWGKPE